VPDVRDSHAPLGRCIDFKQTLHASTERDYIARVIEREQSGVGTVPTDFGAEYWDGDRRFGYGGYTYDGRWLPVATEIAAFYGLRAGDRVLEIGCGKGFLLYDLTRAVPGLEVTGLDLSAYAVEHSKEEIRPYLTVGDAAQLPYADASFDLVLSLTTLYLLPIASLFAALREIERVSRRDKYVMVESYRTEREKYNFLNWQLWAKSFYSVTDWEYVFRHVGYRGDYGFIFYT
jgi:SAM-dependent methyltransferase